MDWQSVTFGNVLTMLVLGLTALIAYFGWQRTVETKFSKLDASFEARFVTMDKAFDVKFSTLALQINTILVGDLAGLRARVAATETDNKDLHDRCHALSNDLNGIGLKVDRLERPRA